MSLYTDVFAGVVAWTNRPDLVTETDTAIRQAVRSAHRSGTYYRDLVSVPLTGITAEQIQQIDLSSAAPNFRRLATVGPTGYDLQYSEAGVLDLFDQDKYPRTDIFYIIGTTLHIRAASPMTDITLVYYKHPTTNPIASLDSWIALEHQDLIICSAAATVLGMVNEPEIKTRAESLAKAQLAELLAEGLTAVGH